MLIESSDLYSTVDSIALAEMPNVVSASDFFMEEVKESFGFWIVSGLRVHRRAG